ncbi:hypothetical protein [Bradyrhizobium sp. C9]|uniref:hypothetical protein n=1 Tax=Bradyrhizobium sp. C9 TaxID=142585 RepID=UPI000BE82630|nr:hypothetical protein [Bradyrhizobium sp. C9]PDT67588.1 hypothetical protein CO675_39550 [Bradyrhizobium sp. C9]
MANKTKADTVLEQAEALLRDVEAANRGARLKKAEREVAASKTRGERLHDAEAQVEASRPTDKQLYYSTMRRSPLNDKPKELSREASAGLARAKASREESKRAARERKQKAAYLTK